ncbi:MAG: secondary thiamine-phosphate synthase enzyme YjbQ [Bacteroidales bacterium]
MISQYIIHLPEYPKGIHLITEEVFKDIERLPRRGVIHLFLQHTSAALAINENYDPDVRHDMEVLYERLAPYMLPAYRHTLEGPDDMPAHFKTVVTGNSLSIPIVNGKPGLGTWQGIYLCEFRSGAGRRILVCTIMGE